MYIRIATIKFPSDDKADAFTAMMKTIWFEKLDKETLNQEQIVVKTGEGKIVAWGIYKAKEDFLKTSQAFKKMWIDFIKSFDGIVEWHEGDVVAHYKRRKDEK
tara:strand:+ start:62 stop:370 length:309 start_codon:yes stop_codon:yes gene_type:complete